MALIVPGDRRFVIIPKHSNLPLAPVHHQRHAGNAIQQQEPYQNNPAQQFQLQQTGTGEYFVYLPYDNLYWAIAGISPNAGAELIQWHDQKTPNQRFRFLYAGDGYYYLRPLHAGGKVLQVPGATHGQDTIKQGELADVKARDHQLFRVMPVSMEYQSNEPRSFQKYSDLLRDATLGLIGAIPKAGGVIKGVLGVLWPDGHDQDFWNQMTQYVDERISEALKKDRLASLRDKLDAARDEVREALETQQPNDRREALGRAISITKFSAVGIQREDAVTVLPLLLAWATLMLTLRAEMHNRYEELHPDEKDAGRIQTGKQDTLKKLTDDLTKFQSYVEQSRADALKKRLAHVSQGEREGRDDDYRGEMMVDTTLWRHDWVQDTYGAGWRQERRWRGAKNAGDYDRRNKAIMDQVLTRRRAIATAQFNAELDALLAPAYLWPYLDPAKTGKAASQQVAVAVGPFGGNAGGTAFGLESGDLTEVTLCWNNDRLCGLELTYSRWSARYMRKMPQSYTYGSTGNHKAQLQLHENEYITNVRGYEWDRVQGLMLETNHGRLVESAHLGQGTYFEAGLDDAVNARLAGISGSYQDATLNTLTFHWEYTLQK
jgi:Ricin-type beta-trefoil lectin domain-like